MNAKKLIASAMISTCLICGTAKPAEASIIGGIRKGGTKIIKIFIRTEDELIKIAGKNASKINKKANAARKAGKETFQICDSPGPNGCRLPKSRQEPRKWKGQDWPKDTKKELAERNNMTPDNLDQLIKDGKIQIDHKLPLSCGGTNKIENLELLTPEQNRDKWDFDRCTKIPTNLIAGGK